LAAGGKPDFNLAASPSSQTVTKPLSGTVSATYTFSVTRVNGMTDPVSLSLSSLPTGVTVGGSGFSPNPVPASGNSATLTLNVGTTAVAGTDTFTVTAAGKNNSQTHTVTFTLVVRSAPQPDFNVSASPATQTISQGDLASIAITVNRLNGFTGNVSLSYSGAPTPSNITLSPNPVNNPGTSATLSVDTSPNVATGTFTVTITATSSSFTHTAQATVVVQRGTPQHFDISGNASGPVYPGAGTPIDLTLHNATNQKIKVSSITVSVEQATTKPGCDGTVNFQVTQLAPAAYSLLVLPPGSTTSLSGLGVPVGQRPQLAMVDTGSSQSVCQNASVYLDYSGTATK
jgi:uncharacterized membrane protein